MINLTDQIKFIEAPNGARFPYCHCLLIEDDIRVLIDSSCGKENLEYLKKNSVEIIVNSHFHEDHILNNHHFPDAAVWAHPLDAPAMRSLDTFLDYYGFKYFDGEQVGWDFIESIDLKASPVHHEFEDGDVLDFGRVSLQVIHTPGHTPGHCIFYEDKSGLLFSADIDLSGFGPWYSHNCSNIDDFILSIKKCIELQPRIIVSGHKGIIREDIPGRLQKYLDTIFRKEEQVISALKIPMNLEELTKIQIIYGEKTKLDPFMYLFEKMGVYQHLQRLIALNQAEQSEGVYFLK
jgi:glyoxylase-like metal-dependent hydrolase (beta-lactamase superfamily II)